MMDFSSPYLISLLLAIPTLAIIMGLFSRRNQFVVDGRTVLLTGGSTGMGRGLGKLLAQKGANVMIVARDEKKLEDAVQYISAAAKDPAKQRFHYISADVTSAKENSRILEETIKWNNGQIPDIVWANVGAAHPDLFIDTPIDTMRKQMDVNFWASCYLAHTTLQTWLKPSASSSSAPPKEAQSPQKGEPLPRHFIMTSSVVCYCGVAGYTPYAPGKSALRSLADTLRSEINLYNGARLHKSPSSLAQLQPETKIHIVLPGNITSPGLEQENKTKHPVTHLLEEGDPSQTEDEVALAAVQGLEKGGYMITTQFLGSAMRAGMLGGSPRNGVLGIRDTLFSWATSVAWLFIGPDMERKVWKWGKENGVKSRVAGAGEGVTS